MSLESIYALFGISTVVSPALLLAVVGLSAFIGRPLSERTTAGWVQATGIAGLVTSVGMLVLMLISGTRNIPIELGNWVALPNFHFHLRLVFDRLSVPFVILSFVLIGTVGAFATRYLHREAGYSRFFALYSLFLLGMVIASLAGTIEMLFLGWELVGLSSALLVAYFYDRMAPVKDGQRLWSVYRMADAAFLIAAVSLHHLTGEGDFARLMGQGAWPDGVAALTPTEALFIGLLLLVAAAGKSGLVPFSGWLPRAMEGPTPSSAVFYGALSVHLGTFLLLRVSPILDASMWLCVAVVVLGTGTAVFAALATRVQSDVKSVLAFASLTQVGIITAEIGFGLRYIALVHIIGHACLRTLQILRAPNLLHDYRTWEDAFGAHLPQTSEFPDHWLPGRLRLTLYRLAFERGYFDAAIDVFIVRPFLQIFRWFDAMERKWLTFLGGRSDRDPDHAASTPLSSGELP
jgi:NAD(P)H-quinone oxidoreductase subunit 5